MRFLEKKVEQLKKQFDDEHMRAEDLHVIKKRLLKEMLNHY